MPDRAAEEQATTRGRKRVRKAFQGIIFLSACCRFCSGTAYIVYFEDALGSEPLKARSVIACLLGTTVTPLVASVTDRSERATVNRVVIRAISEIEAILEAVFDAEDAVAAPYSLEVLARSIKKYCHQYRPLAPEPTMPGPAASAAPP